MIGKLVSALVGREIDRRDGSSGLKGAAIGLVAARVLSRMGPLGIVLGGGYVAKKAYDRHRERRRGNSV